ncbi:putative dehydrogenase [Pullulanibacillus pueri]|uniref:Dehydrogenase n=1 Tax=Pullulanibacillus pueri TaxID=1437324 RepID=A0A8J2ZTU0_9BACL|nr:Gfo/Idh/MocA family oxidoreductase [Pullulanibacillus pueri]MBM7681829.1 putative dehydrogenase [Pullulanibacillus pueri]GGH76252.1 dehydrogenase [Pullulanibacillus pueri]
MISVAMLSKWHVHAGDYARQATENPNLSIEKVWDEDAERGAAWAKELGVAFEADLSKVLADPTIDAVIVDTPTNLHKKVILEAIHYGKHVFTEKVLAFTVKDCEEIYKAAEEKGVKLMASLPRLTESHYLMAQDVLDRGILGELTTIRCRLAHNGAVPPEGKTQGWLPPHFFDPVSCGGGALIDLGAHPIYLTNRLAGEAKSLTASLSSFLGHQVDDNAVVLVDYESGAQGIIEAGFVSNGSPFTLELYGTKGSLLIDDQIVRLNADHPDAGTIKQEDLPRPISSAMQQWVDAILNDQEPAITKKDVIKLTEINEAAALSNKEGRRIELKEVVQKA